MGKLFIVALSSWIMIAIVAIRMIESIKSEKAYKDLYENTKYKKRADVVKMLQAIKCSKYDVGTAIYNFKIEDLIKLNNIDAAKCKKGFMNEFNALSRNAVKGRAVDQYVLETYKEQMKTCKQATKDAVKEFQRTNKETWKHFRTFYDKLLERHGVSIKTVDRLDQYYKMREAMEEQLSEIIEQEKQGILERKVGSNSYKALTSVIKNSQLFEKDRLVELLEIQKDLDPTALDDKDLNEYYTYLNVSRLAASLKHWGQRVADTLTEGSSWSGFAGALDKFGRKVEGYLAEEDVQNHGPNQHGQQQQWFGHGDYGATPIYSNPQQPNYAYQYPDVYNGAVQGWSI